MFEILENNENSKLGAKIRVIGVGGGGCNAVNTMIRSGLTGVEYIVANTDSQALDASLAPVKIQLGNDVTKGLGAGANPEVGRKAALDEYERLSQVIQGADMIFITAGMGGGTGTGAAPVIAKLAKELGALTVGVVTKPFMFEGKKRGRAADEGIRQLRESVDSLITIPNQRLLQIAGQNLSLVETFKKADEVLLNAVRGIADLINNTGHINADFADVRTVMSNKGLALMGTGVASGEGRALKAATQAISSPLLEDISIDGATGIIINITGSDTLTMHETNEAVSLVMQAADEDAEIIFGTVIDNDLADEIKITVIATGLGEQKVAAEIVRAPSIVVKQEVVREEIVHTPTFAPVATPVVAEPIAPVSNSLSDFLAAKKVEEEVSSVEMFQEEKIIATVDEPFSVMTPSTDESPLVQSIRAAASKYEQSKGQQVYLNTLHQTNQATTAPKKEFTVSKGKSMAEKLGFIDFDEDELDTPTFMRNESGKKEPTRSIDL